MALLDPIPEQNFEKARDMIAQILVSEFAVNSINPKVYTERVQEIDKSNFPAVNVVFEGLSNQSLQLMKGLYYTGQSLQFKLQILFKVKIQMVL